MTLINAHLDDNLWVRQSEKLNSLIDWTVHHDARMIVLIWPLIGDVMDRDVIVVDDEVDTGGSIAQAISVVKSKGARDVYMAFIHPIFSSNAAQRLAELPIRHIITTDTVSIPEEKLKPLENRITILSIAPMLGEVIRRAHEGRSVGEMFNE
jgi:ribose-phosphate pyrophosphokinase